MAKNNKDQLPDVPETMEDYMLQQLKKTVILKGRKNGIIAQQGRMAA